jgi:natural product precursor
MKKLGKLKLTQLNKVELEKRQMNSLRGGTDDDNSCICNCSSDDANVYTLSANSGYGYQYSYGGDFPGIVICGCQMEASSMAAARYYPL